MRKVVIKQSSFSCSTFLLFQNVLEQMALRKDSTLEGCLNTLAEGSSLVEQLRYVVVIISSVAMRKVGQFAYLRFVCPFRVVTIVGWVRRLRATPPVRSP